jgi:hypothetical protein
MFWWWYDYINDEDDQKEMEDPMLGDTEAFSSEQTEFPKQFEPAAGYSSICPCVVQAFCGLQHVHVSLVSGDFCVSTSHGCSNDFSELSKVQGRYRQTKKQKPFTKLRGCKGNHGSEEAFDVIRSFLPGSLNGTE